MFITPYGPYLHLPRVMGPIVQPLPIKTIPVLPAPIQRLNIIETPVTTIFDKTLLSPEKVSVGMTPQQEAPLLGFEEYEGVPYRSKSCRLPKGESFRSKHVILLKKAAKAVPGPFTILPSPYTPHMEPAGDVSEAMALFKRISVGATPHEDEHKETAEEKAKTLPRAVSVQGMNQLSLHGTEMRFRTHLMREALASVQFVKGMEPMKIAPNSPLRGTICQNMTLPHFLYRDVHACMNELQNTLSSMYAGIDKDRFLKLYNELFATFQIFIQKKDKLMNASQFSGKRDWLCRFAFNPECVNDIILSLFATLQAPLFDADVVANISQNFRNASDRFALASRCIDAVWGGKEAKEHFTPSENRDFRSSLQNLPEFIGTKPLAEPAGFLLDHQRWPYRIEDKTFDPSDEVPAAMHKAIDGLIAKCLHEWSLLRGDAYLLGMVRYQLETLFNQLSLGSVMDRCRQRYGDAIYFVPYTLSKIREKKLPDPGPKGIEKLMRPYEMVQIPNTNILRMICRAYSLLTHSAEPDPSQPLGFGGCQTVIDIDFSKVTTTCLLLSPGCGTVWETIAGFRENFPDLTM